MKQEVIIPATRNEGLVWSFSRTEQYDLCHANDARARLRGNGVSLASHALVRSIHTRLCLPSHGTGASMERRVVAWRSAAGSQHSGTRSRSIHC